MIQLELTRNGYGLCKCGCGQKTNLARCDDKNKRWIKGEPIAFIAGHHWKKLPPPDIQIPIGCKWCSSCKKVKGIGEFYLLWQKRKDGTRNHKTYCKLCDGQRGADYRNRTRENRRDAQRKYRMKKHYGINYPIYKELFKTQKGKCAICEQPQSHKLLTVDHDHKTGKIRKLLCYKCNSAIGFLNEDIVLVERTLNYLRSHSSPMETSVSSEQSQEDNHPKCAP